MINYLILHLLFIVYALNTVLGRMAAPYGWTVPPLSSGVSCWHGFAWGRLFPGRWRRERRWSSGVLF